MEWIGNLRPDGFVNTGHEDRAGTAKRTLNRAEPGQVCSQT